MAVSGAPVEEKEPSNSIIVDFRNKTLGRYVDEWRSDKIHVICGAATSRVSLPNCSSAIRSAASARSRARAP
jgi:hypothetical protein